MAVASGAVRLKLYKGSLAIAGRRSPHSLYEPGLASFGASETYDHADSAGFIRLFGLPTRVAAARDLLAQATASHAAARSASRHPTPAAEAAGD
jgi:argininosuccinate synthase